MPHPTAATLVRYAAQHGSFDTATATGAGGEVVARRAAADGDGASAAAGAAATFGLLASTIRPWLLAQGETDVGTVLECPGQDVTDTIAGHVGDRSMLMVLDNLRAPDSRLAELAERLLGACPALSILTTGREILGAHRERSWPVPPLSLPLAGSVPAASVLAEIDAIKLFEQPAAQPCPLLVSRIRSSSDKSGGIQPGQHGSQRRSASSASLRLIRLIKGAGH